MPLNSTVMVAGKTHIKKRWLYYSHCPPYLKQDSWAYNVFPPFDIFWSPVQTYFLGGFSFLFSVVTVHSLEREQYDREISCLSISALPLDAGI